MVCSYCADQRSVEVPEVEVPEVGVPKVVVPGGHIRKREALRRLGISMPSLDALIKSGRLRAYRVGSRTVVLDEGDVAALLVPVPVVMQETA